METLTRNLTEQEAARRLGIAEATVRNWLKTGQLASLDAEDVKKQTGRLQKRANKLGSTRKFIPRELLSSSPLARESSARLAALQGVQKREAAGISSFLYSCALKWLEDLPAETGNNSLISDEMRRWRASIRGKGPLSPGRIPPLPREKDCLGLIYQSIIPEGKKSRSGAYYTPDTLIDELLEKSDVLNNTGKKVLEPCCGSGRFLLRLAEKRGGYGNLTGIEKDAVAARITRLNLLTTFPGEKNPPRVIQGNFFTCRSLAGDRFDLIVGNPPWGARLSESAKKSLDRKYPGEKSREISLYFIRGALEHLGPGGEIRFLLPEALLLTRTYGQFRKRLLESNLICRIIRFRQGFSRVQSRVRGLHLKRDVPKIAVKEGDLPVRHAEPGFFLAHPHCSLHLPESDEACAILEKMDKKGVTLLGDNETTWFLGIVTGNNERALSGSPAEGYAPVVRGRDIFPGTRPEISLWIDRSYPFQQAPPLERYTREKIIYRFIADKPVCMTDREGLLCLNSANCLIPPPYTDSEAVCSWLNHPLSALYYRNRFTGVKILRGGLSRLPFPPSGMLKEIGGDEEKTREFFGLTPSESVWLDEYEQKEIKS